MKTSKWIVASSFIASLLIISCGPSTVAVHTRPNSPMYARPAAPRAGYIWVGDDYRWSGGRYIYQPGYWVAPRPGRTYVPGYWNKSRRGDVWIKGRWR
jgi:hypothetical protein